MDIVAATVSTGRGPLYSLRTIKLIVFNHAHTPQSSIILTPGFVYITENAVRHALIGLIVFIDQLVVQIG